MNAGCGNQLLWMALLGKQRPIIRYKEIAAFWIRPTLLVVTLIKGQYMVARGKRHGTGQLGQVIDPGHIRRVLIGQARCGENPTTEKVQRAQGIFHPRAHPTIGIPAAARQVGMHINQGVAQEVIFKGAHPTPGLGF
jgi:hypothetical protein